jgi:hypothetical protein
MNPIHGGEPKTPEVFISIIEGHLPSADALWYTTDRLLKELLDAYREVLISNGELRFENQVFRQRLIEKNGGPEWGTITVDRVQPPRIWALLTKDHGKRKVAFSFDGPPSDAYIEFVDALAMKSQLEALMRGIQQYKIESETYKKLFLMEEKSA